MTPSLAVFGNFTIDDLVFPDGSTRWAVPGGSAIYAAFGASLWVEDVSVVAPLGVDYPMTLLAGRFDLSRCPRVARTLRNWGLYEEDGTRHFLSRSAMRNWSEFSPRPEDASSGYQTAAHIAPLPCNIAVELTRRLRKDGTLTISLDLDDHDLAGSVDVNAITKLLGETDLFLPSLQDVRTLLGGAETLENLRRLRSVAPDVRLIAIKCGTEGVIAHAAGASEWVRVPAAPAHLVSATGAGDAFCGGALAAFAREADVIEALLAGVISASFCVEGFGVAGLLAATHDEACSRLAMLRPRVEVGPM